MRPASPADAAAVGRVLAASYGVLYRGWYQDDVLEAALPLMIRANPKLLSSGRYFIAEIEGAIVACGGWSAEDPRGGDVERIAHARHFATDPAFINRGCGGAILKRSIAEAKAGGFMEMQSISSLTAEAFYARHDFRLVSIIRQPMGAVSFACALMRRSLP